MKTEYKILALSVILGLFIIVVDSALNSLVFNRGSFWQLLFEVPRHENYNSAILLACFLVFGVIAAHLVTARDRTLESLVAREERLATTLHNMPDAVIATNRAGRVTFINPLAQRLTGWSADEATGQPVDEIFRVDDADNRQPALRSIACMMREAAAGSTPGRAVLVCRDGARRPVDHRATPMRDSQGRIMGAVLVFHDVTERRRANEELRQEKETAQRYLNVASVVIVALDANGLVTLINRKGCELLGLPEEKIIGRNWFDHFVPERQRDEIKIAFGKLVQGELAPVEYYENPVVTSTGKECLIAWHNTLLRDGDGVITGTLSSGEDITKQVENIRALQESEERFRAIFTTADDLIFVKDLNLRYTMVNPSMERLLARPASELLGQTEEEVFSITGGCDLIREVDARVLAGETVEEEVTRPIRGKPVTLHVIKVPMRDRAASIIGLYGIVRNITHRKRSSDALRESEARLQRQNAAMAQLDMRKILVRGDLTAAVRRITATAAETLDIERVSVWLYNHDATAIRCTDLYEKSKERHSDRVEIARDHNPAYFAALEKNRIIAAHDAHTDPRTREFSVAYLTPLGITSMLDAPIRTGGRITGVICCEHVGPVRRWALDEQNFVTSMADSITLALEVSDRNRAEAKLRESEERYRDLVERASDGMAVVQDSRIAFINPRLAEMTGYRVDEMIGMPFADYIYPDELEKVQERYTRRIAGEKVPSIYETALRHHDGRRIDVEINAGIINYNGAPADFAFVRNIMERKKAGDVLRYGWNIATNVLSVMDGGALITDEQFNIEYANPVLANLFGPYDGKKCHEYLDNREDTCPRCKKEDVRAGKTVRCQWHSSRTEKTYDLVHTQLPTREGRAGMLITLRDVMGRQPDDRTMDQTRELLDHIFSESLDIIMIIGENGAILKVSQAVATLLGYDVEEFVGNDISVIFSPQPEQSRDELLAKLRVYGGVFDGQKILRADGSVCIMDVTATVIPWEDGRAILATFREAVERKGAEEKLHKDMEQYRVIIENAFDLIVSYTPQGLIIYASPQASHYGYEPHELEGHNITEFIHPDDHEHVLADLRHAVETGEKFLTECRMLGADGAVYHVEEIGKVVREGETVIQITGVIRDITDRKRAEEIINRRDELIKNTIESLDHPFYVIDMEDYTVKLANSAAGFDISSERSTCYALMHGRTTPCDTVECPCLMGMIKKTGQPAHAEQVYIDADGKQRTYEVHGYPIVDRQGKIRQMIEYSLDITDRKRAEEALRDSEEKYRTLYSSMNEGVALHEIICDGDGQAVDYRILDVNPAYENLLGFENEMIIGRRATDVYQTAKPPFLEIYARVAASGDPVAFEEYVESMKKSFHISVFSPCPGRFATIFEDITQHKQFEDKIKMLGRFPEESPSPVLRVDAHGVLIYANEQSWRLLREWDAHVGNPVPEKWREAAAEALDTNEQNEIEFECGDATYLMFVKPVRDGSHINMYALDITEHRRTERALRDSEEQLRQAQKMEAIGRLAGGVAHDFNNLISVIGGHAELLLYRLDADNPLGYNVQEIKETADRACNLTRQLLAFSRKQIFEPQVLNLNIVVVDIETMLRRLIGENIELATTIDPELGPVMADPGQIEQVLMNLVVNARDALPDGGRITIQTANIEFNGKDAHEPGLKPGAYIRLMVSDTGIGMDDETKAHIFEPFYTTKEAGKGTGLGLSTVYGIVTQSSGHLKVDSTPGQGTTFTVYLPRVNVADEAETGDAAAGPLPRGEEIILVVDDEEDVVDLVSRTLRSLGYEVIVAHDGAEALEKSKDLMGKMHLLLTDMVLPHMSGVDLARELIAQHPGLKVVFMSRYAKSDMIKESPIDDNSPFLEKPFAMDHLCRTIRATLDRTAIAPPAPYTPSH